MLIAWNLLISGVCEVIAQGEPFILSLSALPTLTPYQVYCALPRSSHEETTAC